MLRLYSTISSIIQVNVQDEILLEEYYNSNSILTVASLFSIKVAFPETPAVPTVPKS
jgi:hypothetical protein